jgi:hypothetical protein
MLQATKDKNGIITLDGKICPFRSPVLIPSQLGGIEIHQSPCNSQCTHFHYVSEKTFLKNSDLEKTETHNVIVSCGTGVNLPINLTNKTTLL